MYLRGIHLVRTYFRQNSELVRIIGKNLTLLGVGVLYKTEVAVRDVRNKGYYN